MAKLSAHGAEVARWQTTDDMDVGQDLVRQYSLRQDGYILVKTKLDTYAGWSAWRIYGRYTIDPTGQNAPSWARRFRRVLDRKHCTVEEVS